MALQDPCVFSPEEKQQVEKIMTIPNLELLDKDLPQALCCMYRRWLPHMIPKMDPSIYVPDSEEEAAAHEEAKPEEPPPVPAPSLMKAR